MCIRVAGRTPVAAETPPAATISLSCRLCTSRLPVLHHWQDCQWHLQSGLFSPAADSPHHFTSLTERRAVRIPSLLLWFALPCGRDGYFVVIGELFDRAKRDTSIVSTARRHKYYLQSARNHLRTCWPLLVASAARQHCPTFRFCNPPLPAAVVRSLALDPRSMHRIARALLLSELCRRAPLGYPSCTRAATRTLRTLIMQIRVESSPNHPSVAVIKASTMRIAITFCAFTIYYRRIPKQRTFQCPTNAIPLLRHQLDTIPKCTRYFSPPWQYSCSHTSYRILDLLGCGTFGQVVRCQNISTGEFVAVKVIKNKPAYFNQGLFEVKILKMVRFTILSRCTF